MPHDAQYKQSPFAPAMVGREATHDYWVGATRPQGDVHFTVGAVLQSGYTRLNGWAG